MFYIHSSIFDFVYDLDPSPGTVFLGEWRNRLPVRMKTGASIGALASYPR